MKETATNQRQKLRPLEQAHMVLLLVFSLGFAFWAFPAVVGTATSYVSSPDIDITGNADAVYSTPHGRKFVEPGNDFSVDLPSPVEHHTQTFHGQPMDVYTATKANRFYAIISGIRAADTSSNTFDRIVEQVYPRHLDDVFADACGTSVKTDVHGKGWNGKRIVVCPAGVRDPVATMLVAASDRHPVYFVLLAMNMNSAREQSFFNSFEVDNDSVSRSLAKRSEWKNQPENPYACPIGDYLGSVVSLNSPQLVQRSMEFGGMLFFIYGMPILGLILLAFVVHKIVSWFERRQASPGGQPKSS